MQVWFLKFIAPIWQFILKYGLEKITTYFKKLIEKRKIDKKREAAFAAAKEKYNKAGTDPNLTPEQRQKEQEDAFKDFVNSTRNSP